MACDSALQQQDQTVTPLTPDEDKLKSTEIGNPPKAPKALKGLIKAEAETYEEDPNYKEVERQKDGVVVRSGLGGVDFGYLSCSVLIENETYDFIDREVFHLDIRFYLLGEGQKFYVDDRRDLNQNSLNDLRAESGAESFGLGCEFEILENGQPPADVETTFLEAMAPWNASCGDELQSHVFQNGPDEDNCTWSFGLSTRSGQRGTKQ